ncbi:MAG: PEP-CTERM sorting domain-containing protein [Lentisphaeria bacterium]
MMAWGVTACALGVPAVSAGVTFTNLNGTASWVWVEAESGTASGGFGAGWYSSGSVSGWKNDGRNNAMLCEGGDSVGSYFTNTVTVPVIMNNAKMYVHLYAAEWLNVNVYSGTCTSGASLGSLSGNRGELTWATDNSIGALATGDTMLTLATGLSWQYTRVDGYFVASQAIDTSVLTTAANGDYWWMQAPTFSGTLPTLYSNAFTPTVAGAPTGATYWVNGVNQGTGGFGLISGDSAIYNLVLKDSLGDVLAGSSFVYAIPEPASLGLLVLGGLVLARRRR